MGGFQKFILRGNVIELAVAVLIGAAFKAVVDKMVEGVINPVLGMFAGAPNFDEALIFGPVKLGLVLTAAANFLITAAVIYFVFIVPMNKLKERLADPAQAPAPPPPSKEEVLLTEIRDLLKERR